MHYKGPIRPYRPYNLDFVYCLLSVAMSNIIDLSADTDEEISEASSHESSHEYDCRRKKRRKLDTGDIWRTKPQYPVLFEKQKSEKSTNLKNQVRLFRLRSPTFLLDFPWFPMG